MDQYNRGKSVIRTAVPRLLFSIISSSTNASIAVFSCESVAVVLKSRGKMIPEWGESYIIGLEILIYLQTFRTSCMIFSGFINGRC